MRSLGGDDLAYFQHWLGYYLYPEMRCITLFMAEEVTRE